MCTSHLKKLTVHMGNANLSPYLCYVCGYVGTRQYKETLRMGEEILSHGRRQACIGA